MKIIITIFKIKDGYAWKEVYDYWQDARKRLIKLAHSTKLQVVDIETDTPDDQEELWHYYKYGY